MGVGSMTPAEQLKLAKKHLERVQAATWEPDWDDLSLYGFYCLECAVSAAAMHAGIPLARTHPSKADAADVLAAKHGLPAVSDLLRDLNAARKAAAYGDVERPDLDPEDVAADIEKYVQAVERFLEH